MEKVIKTSQNSVSQSFPRGETLQYKSILPNNGKEKIPFQRHRSRLKKLIFKVDVRYEAIDWMQLNNYRVQR
jgi:hypothetical protein